MQTNSNGMSNTHNVKVTRDEKSWEVEVKAEISAEALDSYRTKALNELQKTAKMDGFRPGKAPIEAVLKLYGEDTIMRRAAEMAIQHELPEILVAQQVLVIEAPRVATDVPVAGKPLSFSATAPMAPRVELGDYKAISQKHREITDDTSVTDKEHADALAHIRRERARIDKIETGTEPQKAAEEIKAMEEKDLPEIDDAFAQTIGYADAAAFSEALRANIQHEKELQAAEKRRSLILEELVKVSKISYPARLREYELDDMEARIKDDLARTGTAYEAYLTEIKKTREELRDTWKDAADTRAKVRLILSEIARVEHINPPAEALEHELQHAMERYKDADPKILRTHIAHAMRNEATIRFLEGNDEKVGHTAADHE
ncbi:hypothetical protein FJY93_00040 [Candidatus Kaiserbacteria bacterium]|nr:hypothetical protein [Candidatus Kaiserbacteria bacterium]